MTGTSFHRNLIWIETTASICLLMRIEVYETCTLCTGLFGNTLSCITTIQFLLFLIASQPTLVSLSKLYVGFRYMSNQGWVALSRILESKKTFLVYRCPILDKLTNAFCFSVLVHSGGVTGGHYYAFIRPTLTDQW
jgi:hypothetical protein